MDVDSEGRWIYEDRNGELVNYKDFTHAPEDKHVIGNGLPNGMRDGTILFVIKTST